MLCASEVSFAYLDGALYLYLYCKTFHVSSSSSACVAQWRIQGRGGKGDRPPTVGWSDIIDFLTKFTKYSANISLTWLFPAFTDFETCHSISIYQLQCLEQSCNEVYEKSAAWTRYRNTSWFLPLRLWKRRWKHRRFVTVFLMWSETVSVINLKTLKSIL